MRWQEASRAKPAHLEMGGVKPKHLELSWKMPGHLEEYGTTHFRLGIREVDKAAHCWLESCDMGKVVHLALRTTLSEPVTWSMGRTASTGLRTWSTGRATLSEAVTGLWMEQPSLG